VGRSRGGEGGAFTPSPWAPTGASDDPWRLACGGAGVCNVTFVATPPVVVALWFGIDEAA
jgi:hypothetical protein